MAKDSNPILEFAASAAAGASLAQAEMLTGIPFYQQHQARVDKRTTATEDMSANLARAQAAVGSGLIRQSDVDAYPGGLKEMAKAKDFDAVLGQQMLATEKFDQDNKTERTSMEEAELMWLRSAIPSNVPKPDDAHGMKMVVSQYLRDEDTKEKQLTKGHDVVKSYLETTKAIATKSGLTEADLKAVLVRGAQDADAIRGLDIDEGEKQRMLGQLQAEHDRTVLFVQKEIDATDVEASLVNADYTVLTGRSASDIQKLENSRSGVGTAVGARREELPKMSSLAAQPEILATMRKSDDTEVVEFLDLLRDVANEKDWSFEQIVKRNPDFLTRMSKINWDKVEASRAHAQFVESDLKSVQKEVQQELDAADDDVQRILFGKEAADDLLQASTYIREGTDGKGNFQVTGVDDLYKDFTDRLAMDTIPDADLRILHQKLENGGLGVKMPMLAALADTIEKKLVSKVHSGEIESYDYVLDEQEALMNGTAMDVEQKLDSVLSARLDITEEKAMDDIDLKTETRFIAYQTQRHELRVARERKQEIQDTALAQPFFVPSYAALTDNVSTVGISAQLEQLSKDRAKAPDDAFMQARIGVTEGLLHERRNVMIKRGVFGPPINSVINALGSSEGYAGVTAAVDGYLQSMSGGGGIIDTKNAAPTSARITAMIAELETTESVAGRQELMDDIMFEFGTLVLLSDPRAQEAGLTQEDFAGMWGEQLEIAGSTNMRKAVSEFSKGPLDQIEEGGWHTDKPELMSYQVMTQMGKHE